MKVSGFLSELEVKIVEYSDGDLGQVDALPGWS